MSTKGRKYLMCDECEASFINVIPVHRFRGARCPGSPATAPASELTPTRVLFRVFRVGGDVIAILLDVAAVPGRVMTYQHLGQHAEASYPGIIAGTLPATEEQYKALYNELTGRGYQLVIRKRRAIQGTRHTDTYRAQQRRE